MLATTTTAKLGELFDRGLLHPAWHTQVVLVPLKRAPPAEAEATRALALVAKEMEQAAVPYDFDREVANLKRGGATRDAQTWTASLGTPGDGGFAGVVRTNADHGNAHYVLVVASGGEPAARLHAFAMANPQMPVGDFIYSPQNRAAESYARRNALRVATHIASALFPDAPLHTVIDTEPDMLAADVAAPCQTGESALARPRVHHRLGALEHNLATPRAAIYTGQAAVGTELAVVRDALQGVLLRPAAVGAAIVRATVSHDFQESNAHYADRRQRSDFRDFVHARYVTRTGAPLSHAARALWATAGTATPAPGDVALVPHALIVDGKASASAQ